MKDLQDYKRLIRTAQTYAPWLADVKPWLQHRYCTLANKPFESDFNALRLFHKPAQLYLDVGANRGQSVAAIRMTAKKPRIVSFEANPLLAAKLSDKFGGLPDVRIYPIGLGETEGEFTLYIPKYRNYLFDGLASIDYDSAMSWLCDQTILGFDVAKLSCVKLTCQVKKLDTFNVNPFFIKLDIQGYELNALIGGRKTLESHAPILLIETPGDAISDFLGTFGYRPYSYKDGFFYQGNNGSMNVFFMTEEKTALVAGLIKN